MLQVFPSLQANVLLIGETKVLTALTMKYMTEYELNVDQYTDINAAADVFEVNQNNYDLIITEVTLNGGKEGIQFIRKIREFKRAKRQVPILAISGIDDASRKERLFSIGCNDFLAQPFQVNELASRANSLIVNKQLLDKVDDQQEKLNRVQLTDPLTGLYNQNYFIDQANKFIPLAKRHDFPLSLIMLELDHFDNTQETYGYTASHVILQCVGVLIKSTTRQEDVAARLDTKKLAILLPYCDKKGAFEKAERLRSAIDKLNPDNIRVTASFAVSSIHGEDITNLDNLLKSTTKGVDKAKKQGGNQLYPS